MKPNFHFARNCPTVCVTGGWAGRDNAREQENAEARKNAWKSGRLPHVQCTLCWKALRKTRWLKTRTATIKLRRLLHELSSLARTKKWLTKILGDWKPLFTQDFPKKYDVTKKPNQNLPKLLPKKWSRFWEPTKPTTKKAEEKNFCQTDLTKNYAEIITSDN